MYAMKVKPRLRMFAGGKLNREHRAIDGLPIDRLGDLRARMANASMVAAIDGLLGLAGIYAGIARKIDAITGNPYGMSAEDWDRVLLSYARRPG